MSEGAKICNHMGLLILLCLSLPMKVSVLRCSRTVEHRFYSRVSLTRISSLFIHTVHDMWNWTKSLGKPQDRYFTVNYLPRKICETFWALHGPWFQRHRNTRPAFYYRVTREMLRVRHFSRDLPRVTLTRHCPFSCVVYCMYMYLHVARIIVFV